MKLNLAENLKRLRKERGITQEELAGFIGVTFQAISKWERGEGYPDITLLPSIAGFFEVTLDELVGMNEIQNRENRERIIKAAQALSSEGKIGECVAVLREGLHKFPNDFRIMADLACFLDGYGKDRAEIEQNRRESIRLSERILEFCTDNSIRNSVQANVCFTLWRSGETERAVRMARELPTLYKTAEATLPKLLRGRERVEYCQNAIQELHWHFWWLITCMIEEEHYSDDEKIALLKKSIAFYEIVYEKQDYAFAHVRLADAYEDIAVLQLKQGRVAEGLESLSQCADHCVAFDTLPDCQAFDSLLVNTRTYVKQNTSKFTQNNSCRNVLNSILRDLKADVSVYRQCQSEALFGRIVARLEEVAN